jgi:hypothetical protein
MKLPKKMKLLKTKILGSRCILTMQRVCVLCAPGVFKEE